MASTPSDTLDLVNLYQLMIRYGNEVPFLQPVRYQSWGLRIINDYGANTGYVSDIQAANYHQRHHEVDSQDSLIRVAHAIYLKAMNGSAGFVRLNYCFMATTTESWAQRTTFMNSYIKALWRLYSIL